MKVAATYSNKRSVIDARPFWCRTYPPHMQRCSGRGGPARPSAGERPRLPGQPRTHMYTQRKGPTVSQDHLHLWLDKERRRCARCSAAPALQASTPERVRALHTSHTDHHSTVGALATPANGFPGFCALKRSREEAEETREGAK